MRSARDLKRNRCPTQKLAITDKKYNQFNSYEIQVSTTSVFRKYLIDTNRNLLYYE
jgi:hypothetical protein